MEIANGEESAKGVIAKTLSLVLRTFRSTPTVFISYRRADTAPSADRIDERLVRALGRSNVFYDKHDTPPGKAFKRLIERRLKSSQVLLVVVGKEWVDARKDGRRRLEDPEDFVRQEVEMGIERAGDCRLIPVLVHGQSMLTRDRLPPSLAPLCDFVAHEIRQQHFDEDLGVLIQDILGIRTKYLDFKRVTRFHRFAPFMVVAAVLAMFSAAWVKSFDILTLDTQVESYIMGVGDLLAPFVPSDTVALVAISKDTERRLRKSFDKTWRRDHARLIDRLAEAGASVVVFDILVDEPSDYDQELVAAVSSAQRKGTTVIFGSERGSSAAVGLANAGAGFGLLCLGSRKAISYATLAPLVVKKGSQYLPSITALARVPGGKIEKFQLEYRQILARDSAGQLLPIKFSEYEDVSGPDKGCPAIAQNDTVAQVIIRLSPLKFLRDAAKRQEYEEALEEDGNSAARRYKGKIVLVGVENDSEKRNVWFGLHKEERFGYEIHADVLHTLVQEVDIRPWDTFPQFALMLFMGALGNIVILSRPMKTAIVRHGYLCVVAVCYMAIALWLYVEVGLLLSVPYDLGAFFLAYWLSVRIARRLGLWETRTY